MHWVPLVMGIGIGFALGSVVAYLFAVRVLPRLRDELCDECTEKQAMQQTLFPYIFWTLKAIHTEGFTFFDQYKGVKGREFTLLRAFGTRGIGFKRIEISRQANRIELTIDGRCETFPLTTEGATQTIKSVLVVALAKAAEKKGEGKQAQNPSELPQPVPQAQ